MNLVSNSMVRNQNQALLCGIPHVNSWQPLPQILNIQYYSPHPKLKLITSHIFPRFLLFQQWLTRGHRLPPKSLITWELLLHHIGGHASTLGIILQPSTSTVYMRYSLLLSCGIKKLSRIKWYLMCEWRIYDMKMGFTSCTLWNPATEDINPFTFQW